MTSKEINLVLISGPVGVGKSTLSNVLSGLLNDQRIQHTQIDLDGLANTYPRTDADPYGQEIALSNLSAVWSNCLRLGVRNLIIARVIETRSGAQRIEQAVGAHKSIIVQLSASDAILRQRIRGRELGSGRKWHEDRAIELSRQLAKANLADIQIDTDYKSIEEMAASLVDQISWV